MKKTVVLITVIKQLNLGI